MSAEKFEKPSDWDDDFQTPKKKDVFSKRKAIEIVDVDLSVKKDGMLKRKGGTTERQNQKYVVVSGRKRQTSQESMVVQNVGPLYKPMTHERITVRNIPGNLVSLVENLNPAQLIAIEDMGFSSVVFLKLPNVPTCLGRWLIGNYDANNNSLNVGSHKIEITRELVSDVLGIPHGTRGITEMKKPSYKDPVIAEWRNQFGPKCPLMTALDVIKKMKACSEHDRIFKLNFLVVYMTIMGETTKGGTVNMKFLKSMTRIEDVPNMDWCGYMITLLKRTKMLWKTTEHYNGPLPLLALVYAHDKGKHLLPQLPALQHYEVEALEKLQDDLKGDTNSFIIYMKEYIEMKNMESTVDLVIDGFNVNNCLVNRDGGDPMTSDVVAKQVNAETEVTGNVVNQKPREDVKMKINEIGKLLDEVVQLVEDGCYEYNEDDGLKEKVCSWGSLVDHLKSKMFYNSTNNSDDEDGFTSTMWCEAEKAARKIESIFLGGETMNLGQATNVTMGCEQPNFDLGISQVTPTFQSMTPETPTTKPQPNAELAKASAPTVGLSVNKTPEFVITPAVAIPLVKPIAEAMKREPRLIKLPDILRSPFVRKKVSLVMKKSTVEVNLGTTVFAANKDPWNLLFESETGAAVKRVSFETLHPDVPVHVSVIQAWASVLNNEDKFRNKSDPPRLFCTPNMLCAEDFGEDFEVSRRITTFHNNMDIVLKDAGLDSLVGIELVFIPMLHSDHYYVMCFNLKKGQVDVIDNSEIVMLDSKYERKLQIMQETMCLYLTMASHLIADELRRCTPTRLSMPWRTLNNKVDSGIFMMRHMETYKGTSINAWKCGLTAESEAQNSQLTDLRVKYVAKILLADINKHKEFVISEIRDYVKLPIEERAMMRNNSVERIMERVGMCCS